MSSYNKTPVGINQPDEKGKKSGKNTQENEDDMFVLVDRKNPIVKSNKLVSSWDGPSQANKQDADKGKGAKKADDGFERVPVYGGNPGQQSNSRN